MRRPWRERPASVPAYFSLGHDGPRIGHRWGVCGGQIVVGRLPTVRLDQRRSMVRPDPPPAWH
jgi:hypothetical protein